MSCTDAVAALEAAGAPLRTRRGRIRVVDDHPAARSITRQETPTMTTELLIDRVRAAISGQLGSPATPASTNRNVARLEPDVRRHVAGLFAGRRVEVDVARGSTRSSADVRTVTGYLVTVAMLTGANGDVAVLAEDYPDGARRTGLAGVDVTIPRLTNAIPLATITAIREL